jgi:EAL domain-containing protein (putative c-di-GMP-specific phosphodiesterase class I)
VYRALGTSIIAEGVETHEAVAYLLGARQIRYAQGYSSPSRG